MISVAKVMEKLFSYGTLQQANVQLKTFGRIFDGKGDVLPGYVLSDIKIKDKNVIETSGTDIHPILKYTGNSNDEVEGIVFEITQSELNQSDNYEVDEYKRILATLKSGTSAWVYTEVDDT